MCRRAADHGALPALDRWSYLFLDFEDFAHSLGYPHLIAVFQKQRTLAEVQSVACIQGNIGNNSRYHKHSVQALPVLPKRQYCDCRPEAVKRVRAYSRTQNFSRTRDSALHDGNTPKSSAKYCYIIGAMINSRGDEGFPFPLMNCRWMLVHEFTCACCLTVCVYLACTLETHATLTRSPRTPTN